MKKKIIIFDLADTLLELEPSPQKTIRRYFKKKYNIDLNENNIRKSLIFLSNIFHYSSVKIKKNESKKEFYLNYNNHLLNMIGVSHVCNPEEIYQQILSQKSHWVKKEGVSKLLNYLKKSDYKLALISNFNYKEAIEILKNLGILDLFDYLHISEKEGLEKPNIEFYNLFFEKNNLIKQSCLYFGDSYTLDFVPSNKIDLSFVLIDELNLFKQISNKVNNINQIVDFIK